MLFILVGKKKKRKKLTKYEIDRRIAIKIFIQVIITNTTKFLIKTYTFVIHIIIICFNLK